LNWLGLWINAPEKKELFKYFDSSQAGDEPTKGGIESGALPLLLGQIASLKNLRVEGLMSLPPIEAEPEASRKFFIQLRDLRDRYHALIPSESGSFSHLSMGTTHDFEVAVEEGATMVRVGTAVFGVRKTEARH